MILSRPKSARIAVAPCCSIDHSATKRRPRSRIGSSQPDMDDPAIRHWLGAFHHFHSDSRTYTSIVFRYAPTEAEDHDTNSSENRSAAPLATGRHVYEVALRRDARSAKWVLICWEVDVPGIQFCDCADRDEAMALFADPVQATGRWHGVRLRLEHRPW